MSLHADLMTAIDLRAYMIKWEKCNEKTVSSVKFVGELRLRKLAKRMI